LAERVVVAMSGGVDSSVAAWLLVEQGYEVIGLFMRTGVHTDPDSSSAGHGCRSSRTRGCCSSLDAADARHVAAKLGIPFYALDFQREFGAIMDYFADEYYAGRTPNPCVVCNNWLKFGELYRFARALGAQRIATGHYARLLRGTRGIELHKARDPLKDQSYVLFGIRRSVLEDVLFPLGDYAKSQVRELARRHGLAVADKPDSQEICFVPDGDYVAFLRRHRPGTSTAGKIIDCSGRVLGEHQGIEHFTIGQRKGLGLALGEPYYVVDIIARENLVVVGPREACSARGLIAREVNWLDDVEGAERICQVKIRYRSPAVAARVRLLPQEKAEVVFDQPQLAVTPGQAAVFYDGTRVLGGGWIESALGLRSCPQRLTLALPVV